ncbi:MAG: threonine-phosphate decarboxylase [Nitrososphaeria archaeon]|nr:threonine-phosphate decarboxylase [Nitrososphaeria archaeon]NDB46193.1 threonine-phosphate decarboxylase [Nitrososphaeria archaeon]NDB91818.1 threonine-phosphate decarboxylase [Nitrososphaeria archaeon]NDF29380.1 threonine-phosphate decarboxylase [Nitrososphaeria archaeon]NDF34990.1 threonine-phosphate decarboxylase [Nitrosopumilaceae archaeon]
MKFAKNIRSHSIVRHGGPYSISGYGSRVLDFSSNVNPLGYPSTVKLNLDKIPVYPDHDSVKLKQVLSRYVKIPKHNITIGNGATEIIYDFCRATTPNRVLIVAPTFGEYEAACRLCGARPEFFTTLNLQNDLEGFIKKIPKNGIVFVCNPNNPTGELVSKESIISIIKTAKSKSSLVFVDECFIELTQTPDQSVLDMVSKFDNLFVLRSLTKSFGLAGLRLGYGIGNKNLVSILDKIKVPWSVNGLAHQAGILALSDKKFLPKTRKLIKTESTFLINSLSKLGFFCSDTKTNFILIKTKQPSKVLQKKLLQKNILVRDCSNFRGLDKYHIRIAVRTRKENKKLVSAFEAIL